MVFSTAPAIGTPKCASYIAGVFGDRIADANAQGAQRRGEAAAARISLAPGLPQIAVDQRDLVRKYLRRPRQEAERGKGNVVGRILAEPIFERVHFYGMPVHGSNPS
jgi:hypothetical protein